MDRDQAVRLIRETFENPFDKSRFERFIGELLKTYERKPLSPSRPYSGNTIKDQFRGHISSYERLGKYTDSDRNLIDILIVRTNRESSLGRARTLQRDFIAWYLNGGRGGITREAALVAVVAPNEETWRFSLVRMDYELTRTASAVRGTTTFTPARRYSFLVGKNENTHTAQERLLPILQTDDRSLSLDTLQQAFSVEKVTSDFYDEYDKVFKTVEGMIKGLEGDKRLFTQRLFNRLLFIRFLEKKKWLRYEGNQDYLEALLDAAKRSGQTFYRDRLRVLFFEGLGRMSDYPSRPAESGRLTAARGEVPFLNGGLFEKENGDDSPEVDVPNEAFDLVFDKLLRVYNFTVEEGTPVDVDVAVDPEMLGRVFEKLVTGRHDTGSYYTPKPIVSFMCREALKGYLLNALTGESPEAVSDFVDAHDPGGIRNAENALDALRKVRVCDPACGSGAYLLGMLHELVDLRGSLLFSRKTDDEGLYNKKLEIISRNLYGVDLDPFAVNIARLRLWLSLVVEDQRNPLDDPALDVSLPNLDFKVEIGDSIRTPQPAAWLTSNMFHSAAVRQFESVKASYMRAHGERKSALREDLDRARAEVAEAAGRECSSDFDWQVEFAEVFLPVESMVTIGGALNLGQELTEQPEPGGFDIVLTNPPYVRQERIKDIKPDLKRTYGSLYCGRADLYVYFYCRALQLLRAGGMLVFISSNKWLRAKYGEKLRAHVAETCAVRSITDFGELPVFDAPATFPMIVVAQKGRAQEQPTAFTQVRSLDPPYPDVLALVHGAGRPLPLGAFSGANWTVADADTADLMHKMEGAGPPLLRYADGNILAGIKTGYNRAFWLTEQQYNAIVAEQPECSAVLKPLLLGDEIRRWHLRDPRRWLIYTPPGTDMSRYRAVIEHLGVYRKRLSGRALNQEWYELQQAQVRYSRLFTQPKIVYPDIAMHPRFAYDSDGSYIDMTAFAIPLDDLFLLGVLNSQSVWAYLSQKAAVLGDMGRRGRLRLKRQYLAVLPIPSASATDRAAISALVQKCLDAKGVDCEAWEKEIDERVAALYGL